MSFKEIKIPVPWGYICGKAWGNEKDDCVIALHGYQDNANSFDNLIPLLPKSFYYISIDLPGHGRSSHFDISLIITSFDFILALKLVLDYLNRKKYILLAHSFGSQIAIFFTEIYPEYISKLISLDGLLIPRPITDIIDSLKRYMDRYATLRTYTTESAPAYTLDEAVQRMKNGRPVLLKDAVAKMLIERSLIPAGNRKFKMTTAQYLKHLVRASLTLKQLILVLKEYPVRCPYLLITADQSSHFFQLMEDYIAELRKNKYFEFHTVKGSHDVHMEEPEKVAPIVSEFLLKNIHKL